LSRFTVVVTDLGYATYEPEKQELAAIDAELVFADCKTAQDVAEACRTADAILNRYARIGPDAIAALEKCRVISRYGVGVDTVDLAAATRAGIPVANVTDYCMDEVSAHALALLLSCIRRTVSRDRQVRQGMWEIAGKEPVHRIEGKVLGLIAFGRIARALHRKVAGFGLSKVLAYDPYVPPEDIERAGAKPASFDEVLTRSDYISVHPPLTEETHHMVGADEFAKMKPTAIFVNTSRGPVVDPDALYDALKHDRIMSAGIDVHEPEPLGKGSRFFDLPNVVLTDHAAWYSEESENQLKRSAAQNVALVLSGKPPRFCVNPEVLKS